MVLEITKKTEEIQFGKKARRNDFVSMNVLTSQSKWRKKMYGREDEKEMFGKEK